MFRTIKDISITEELTVSYINLFNNNRKRQEIINNSRFFNCYCERCNNNNNYINCLKNIYNDDTAITNFLIKYSPPIYKKIRSLRSLHSLHSIGNKLKQTIY